MTGFDRTLFLQVRQGNPVSEDYHDYWGRVKVNSANIEILKVNYTDEGLYVLKDRIGRDVSFTRLEITGGLWNCHTAGTVMFSGYLKV